MAIIRRTATMKITEAHAKKRELRIVCLLLPLLLKGADAYLHCDRTADFFTGDLAANVALLLAEFLLMILDNIYLTHGPREDTPSKRRIVYGVFQIIMALAIFGTGVYCFVGNLGSAISNAGAAAASTDDVVQRVMTDSWRMDPFDVCSANDQGRILEVFRQQPEIHRSTHRAATLIETILAIGWAAITVGFPFVHVTIWKMTQAQLEGANAEIAEDPEQNTDLAVNCVQHHDGTFCSPCCEPVGYHGGCGGCGGCGACGGGYYY